jgi:hypothetical protein
MKIFWMVWLLITLLGGVSMAQSSTANPPDEPRAETRFAPDVQLRVELDKSVDAKKAKPGDPVVARMMDELMAGDKVMAPRGAKVIGHLIEATPHQGEMPSTLGIAFDKMVLPDGKEVPLEATIQAVGRPEEVSAFGQNGPVGGNGGPGYGGMGGIGGNNPMGRTSPGMSAPPAPGVSPAPGNPNNGPTDGASQTVNGQLTPNSQGVINMSGVSLSTGSTGDSVLSSQKHNIKLDSGTQMVLHTK